MEKYLTLSDKGKVIDIEKLKESLKNDAVKDEIYKIEKIDYSGKEREMIHFIRILEINSLLDTYRFNDALKILLDNMDEKYIGESFEDNFIEVFFNDDKMSSLSSLSKTMTEIIPSLVNLLVKNPVNSDTFILKLMKNILLESRTDYIGENKKKYLFQYIEQAHKKNPTSLTISMTKIMKKDGTKSKSRMKKRKSKRKSVRKSVRKSRKRKNNQ
uniref:Uncharacterized protein n=1 Tax=viral metagenome TaxID=1070528 RepID=A0A6C0E1Z2_9ZZZZ